MWNDSLWDIYHQSSNELKSSNYRQSYILQQWAKKTYRMIGLKRPWHEKSEKSSIQKTNGIMVSTSGTYPLSSVKQVFYESQPTRDNDRNILAKVPLKL